MINQIISCAMWKGMSQKNFPMWSLMNAYNQQPERLLEMQRAGFFPTEQGPMPFGNQKQLPDPNQRIEVIDDKGNIHYGTLHQSKPEDTHLAKLESEVSELKDVVKSLTGEIGNLVKFSKQQDNRLGKVENRLKP